MSFLERLNSPQAKQTQKILLLVIVATTLIFGLLDVVSNFQAHYMSFLASVVLMSAIGYAAYKKQILLGMLIVFILVYFNYPAMLVAALRNAQHVSFPRLLNLIIGTIICVYLALSILASVLFNSESYAQSGKLSKMTLILLAVFALHAMIFGMGNMVAFAVLLVVALALRVEVVAIILVIYANVWLPWFFATQISSGAIGHWSAYMYIEQITAAIILIASIICLVIALQNANKRKSNKYYGGN